MSPELANVLRDWLAWVDAGAPHGKPFDRDDGLCWVVDFTLDDDRFGDELDLLFRRDDLDPFDPFGSWNDGFQRCTMHLCGKRVAWVRQKVAAL